MQLKIKRILRIKKHLYFWRRRFSLDWTLELSKFSNITLIHRRDEFRGAQYTLDAIKKLEKQGKISIKTPFQLEKVEGDNEVTSITIKDDNGKTENIKTDVILSFLVLL